MGKNKKTLSEPGNDGKSKAQRKKEARAADTAAQKAIYNNLASANEITDATASLPSVFKTYTKKGCDLKIVGYSATTAPQTLMEAAFDLCKENMEMLYNVAEFQGKGWSDRAKKKELLEEEARYIFALTADTGELAGFIHFRFEAHDETGEEIIYLYEIQLAEPHRRKGMGSFFMALMDIIGRKLCMKRVVCTVLKNNEEAMRFYKDKMGFYMDESSPEYTIDQHGPEARRQRALVAADSSDATNILQQMINPDEEEDELCEYEILCKPIRQAKQPDQTANASEALTKEDTSTRNSGA